MHTINPESSPYAPIGQQYLTSAGESKCCFFLIPRGGRYASNLKEAEEQVRAQIGGFRGEVETNYLGEKGRPTPESVTRIARFLLSFVPQSADNKKIA